MKRPATRAWVVSVLLPLVLVSAAPPAAADGITWVIQRLDGPRCYIWDFNSNVQYWIETNGVITGGEEHVIDFAMRQVGAPDVIGGTGLQRNGFVFQDGAADNADHVPGDNVPPDARLEPVDWAQYCGQAPAAP